jgi:hypothetical protein
VDTICFDATLPSPTPSPSSSASASETSSTTAVSSSVRLLPRGLADVRGGPGSHVHPQHFM